MKYLFMSFLLTTSVTALAQFPWNGYDLYDWLVEANHPQGCDPDYVTFLPDDSTWVNMLDFSVMTGYFGMTWNDQPGDDLLLETSFHRDNYSVRLILAGGGFSDPVPVDLSDWTQIANEMWKHMFPGCIGGTANFEHFMFAMDFEDFGVGPDDDVVGIEITFLPTSGSPDFAGAYIIVPPCGMFSLGPDTTLCPGETMDIDASTPNATYLWQDGSTDPIYPNADAGKYWVEVTLTNCSIVDTINIYEASDLLDLGDDVQICPGESVILDAAIQGATYAWQDNSSQSTYTATEPGLYWVIVEFEDCVFADSVEVDFVLLPPLDLGEDTTLCEGFSLQLDATTPNASYEWQDGEITPMYFVTDPGTYAVTLTIDGCTVDDMIDVEYFYMDPIDFGDDVILCEGEILFLDAFTPAATYEWQDNSNNSSYNVTQPGIYSVTVTLNNCTTTDAIEVDYQPATVVNLGADITACNGETIILDATTPGATYQWQDNSSQPTYTVTQSGTYAVTVEVDNCQAADSIAVNFVDALQIDLGNDTTLCPGNTAMLAVNIPGATYSWQDQSTSSSYLVNQAGVYWVSVTVGNCHAVDTIAVSYASLAPFDLGNDTTLCAGETLLLNPHIQNVTYHWQDNASDSTYTVTTAGEYAVTVGIQGCEVSDSILVNFVNAVQFDLGNDTTLCQGASIVLQADIPGATYIWQDNSTASTLLVNQAGMYSVTVTLNQCASADTVLVGYLVLSSVNLGNDTILCEGESLLLDPQSPGANHVWQDNSTASTFLVSQPGTYFVDVSLNNCNVRDTIAVSFHILELNSLGNDTVLCPGKSVLLTAITNGTSVQWQDNSIGSAFLVTAPGSYWVTASLENCFLADTILVSYFSLSTIDLGNDTTLCKNQTLTLDATTTNATYNWQDGSGLSTYTVSAAGEYTVTVSVDGCQIMDTIIVSYLEVSSVNLGSDTTLCWGDTITLYSNAPGANYLWSDNSTAETLSVSQPGSYWVQVSLAACSAADTIAIEFSDPVFISLGPDTILCPGETIVLDAETTGGEYQWQDNSTIASYAVVQSGSYWVIVDVAGCKGADTVDVVYTELPIVDLGNDTILCEGDLLELQVSSPMATYIWQDNSTNSSFQVTHAGTYAVTVSLGRCKVQDDIVINLAPSLIVDLGIDRTICDGETVLLDANLSGDFDFLWQDNTTSETYVSSKTGDYWLAVTDDCGVSADTISVFVENCDCPIYVPNAFSPNGDNINDVFAPQAGCALEQYLLRVFDRDGGLLFETREIGAGWTGLVNTDIAQVGVYAYILRYTPEGKEEMQIAGDVTIVR